MKLYRVARSYASRNEIEIEEVEVTKETPKTLEVKGHGRVIKAKLDLVCSSYSLEVFTYDKWKALGNIKQILLSEIERYNLQANRCKQTIEYINNLKH